MTTETVEQLLAEANELAPSDMRTYSEFPHRWQYVISRLAAELRRVSSGALREAPPTERGLRELLWLRHGCPVGALYGDDGEMSCGACGIDFKQWSGEQIAARFKTLGEAALRSGPALREAAPAIYVASKSAYGPMWRRYRDSGQPIISTWIDESGPGETVDHSDLWRRCIAEAKRCTALIFYAENGEPQRGALVEIGAALGNGRPVYVVDCGMSWEFESHPLVQRVPSLDAAFEAAGARAGEAASEPSEAAIRAAQLVPLQYDEVGNYDDEATTRAELEAAYAVDGVRGPAPELQRAFDRLRTAAWAVWRTASVDSEAWVILGRALDEASKVRPPAVDARLAGDRH